jgi:hypothetical protein
MTLNTLSDTTALRQKVAATGTAQRTRQGGGLRGARHVDQYAGLRSRATLLVSRGRSIEDEAIRENTNSGLPMFKDEFPSWPRFRHPSTPRAAHRAIAPARDAP